MPSRALGRFFRFAQHKTVLPTRHILSEAIMNKTLIVATLSGAALAGAFLYAVAERKPDAQASTPAEPGSLLVEVRATTLSGDAVLGERAFNAKCASCHGPMAAGQAGLAPPLIHKIYEPNHHGDMSFHIAVQNGVRAHHWPFGNMPPVAGLTKADVNNIVSYIRALQQENGIF